MNHFLSIAACAMMIGAMAPASAAITSDEAPASLTAPTQGGSSATILMARRGADDPAGHVRGGGKGNGKGRGGRDDGANHT